MHGEPPLPVTPTNSGNETKGTILGFEGMSIVPVIGGAVMSILLLVVLVPGASDGIFPRILISLAPVGSAVGYVLLFVHKKPPHYRQDSFELLRGKVPVVGRLVSPHGLAFNAAPQPPPHDHPFIGERSPHRPGS